LYFGLKLIREYNIEIRRFYSNIGGKDLNPIEWLLLFFVFACVISVVSSIIGKDYFMVHPLFLIIPSFTHSLFLFGVGYFGYKQNFTIEEFKKDIAIAKAESKLYSEKQITNVKNEILNNEELQKKLFQLLEEDKIYRQPELRITDVANLLNTNRTYISKIINDELHTNFSDLINEYRIESAKNQLLDCTKNALSLTEIAENSGFSTNSSFYRVFKNKVGVSPGDFRKKGCDSTLMQFKGMIK
jgi:AraC-like DNA-binding protein